MLQKGTSINVRHHRYPCIHERKIGTKGAFMGIVCMSASPYFSYLLKGVDNFSMAKISHP